MTSRENNRLKEIFASQANDCYSHTTTLINKFNMQDGDQLEKVSSAIAAYKISKLYYQSEMFQPTIDYYLALHEYIFKDIYPFSGQIRSVNIQKSNEPYIKDSVTPFCRPEFIYANLSKTINQMRVECHSWENETQMINRLAYYYGELNVIHPFREGNGRTQREFFRQFVLYANRFIKFGKYQLDYAVAQENPNIRVCLVKGSIEYALTGNTRGLELFLKSCLQNYEIGPKKR